MLTTCSTTTRARRATTARATKISYVGTTNFTIGFFVVVDRRYTLIGKKLTNWATNARLLARFGLVQTLGTNLATFCVVFVRIRTVGAREFCCKRGSFRAVVAQYRTRCAVGSFNLFGFVGEQSCFAFGARSLTTSNLITSSITIFAPNSFCCCCYGFTVLARCAKLFTSI